tara:strand:- start:1690 stop:1866 length:177 start_codon:yes stop_codon:yes gene_type:complete
MTIKQLKTKVEAVEKALKFPALPNDNAVLVKVLQETLIDLQTDLIQKMEHRHSNRPRI